MGKKKGKNSFSVVQAQKNIEKNKDRNHAAYHGKMANEKDMQSAKDACAYGVKGCPMK